MSNWVFVLDSNRKRLSPCHPARADELKRKGKAKEFRRYPYTIILQYAVEATKVRPLQLKIDPGSKTTGFAILDKNRVIWAAELEHRKDQIKALMDSRRNNRGSRRSRKTRYRPARFDNRKRAKGWLPPALRHLVETTQTWVNRLRRAAPISSLSVEQVRFDMQLIRNPEIQGVEYQQGELWQQEVRQFVFARAHHTCIYCDKQDVPLQIEHIIPRSKGGSNAPNNLTASCVKCNQEKGNLAVEVFLVKKPDVLKRLRTQLKAPLKGAAAVNATRKAIVVGLEKMELPVETGTGGQTAYNRKRLGLEKAHWIDAACVGLSTPDDLIIKTTRPLLIKSVGRGSRQMCRTNKHGFPIAHRTRQKQCFGFRTGDIVKLVQGKGKYVGTWIGRLASVRPRGWFTLKTACGKRIEGKWNRFRLIHHADGYVYA